jgi:hypothetical protein
LISPTSSYNGTTHTHKEGEQNKGQEKQKKNESDKHIVSKVRSKQLKEPKNKSCVQSA